MTESGFVKLYLEINEAGTVTYVETLPEATITCASTLKRIIKVAFGYKYEANYAIPAQSGLLKITIDLTKKF